MTISSPLASEPIHFSDTIGIIVGVSEVAYAHLSLNQSSTAKRDSLKDLRLCPSCKWDL
jgi:hypothetical protein